MTIDGISDSSSVEKSATTTSSRDGSEIVLQLSANHRLAIAWGGMVVQKPGVVPMPFGDNDSHWLVLVTKGILRAKIGDNTYTVTKGQTLTLLRGELCNWAKPNETELQFQWIAYRIKAPVGGRRIAIQVPRVAEVPDAERMAELLRLLTEEYHSNQFSLEPCVISTNAVHYLLMSALGRLDPSEPKTHQPIGASAALAERAKDYIRIHLGEPITTSSVAKALDCNSNHLGIVFRKTYGESPIAYIQRTRVAVSLGLLIKTRMSISQIAIQVGFPSLNYYSRVFKRLQGMTPSEYRNAHSHLCLTDCI